MDHAQLIYGLMMKMDMDLGSMISSQITYSNSLKLGVPTLITAFYDIKGVILDTLTFESLSPMINLPYIRKNYWNPIDPSTVISGPRRARAHAAPDAPPVIPPSVVPPLIFASPSLLSTPP